MDDKNVTPSSKIRILVVDDNQDAVKMLSKVVEILGNEVYTAYDGLEAVEKAAKFRPHMVLMDLGMPNLNGYTDVSYLSERFRDSDALLMPAVAAFYLAG